MDLIDVGRLASPPPSPHEVVLDGARIAALTDLGLLDTQAEADFDRYTRLAKDLLGVWVSLVSLVDADRQFIKSQAGLPGRRPPSSPRRSGRSSARRSGSA